MKYILVFVMFYSIAFAQAQELTNLQVSILNANNKVEIGEKYFSSGNYDSAVLYLEYFNTFCEQLSAKDNWRYEKSVFMLGQAYKSLANYDKAEDKMKESIIITKKRYGAYHKEYFYSLSDLIILYVTLGEVNKALILNLESIDNYPVKNSDKDIFYGAQLMQTSRLYRDLGEYDKSLWFYSKGHPIIINHYGKKSWNNGWDMIGISETYGLLGNYDTAISVCLKGLEIVEKSIGQENKYFDIGIENLTTLYYKKGAYGEAILVGLGALESIENRFGKQSLQYGLSLNTLGVVYSQQGNYASAISCFKEALEIRKKALADGISINFLASLPNNLANAYCNNGEYDNALALYQESLSISVKFSSKREQEEYLVGLFNIIKFYRSTREYSKAFEINIESLKLIGNSIGKNNKEYSQHLSSLANIYADIGQYELAVRTWLEAKDIYENIIDEKDLNYSYILADMASMYCLMGEFSKALSIYDTCLVITKKYIGTRDYPLLIGQMARVNFSLNNYDKSLLLFSESLNLIEKNHGVESYKYGLCLGEIAFCYSKLGDVNKARNLFLDAIKIIEKSFVMEQNNVWALGVLKDMYVKIGEISKAISINNILIDIVEKDGRKENRDYGLLMFSKALLYAKLGEYNETTPYFISANNILLNEMQEIFSFRSEYEKKAFLMKESYRFSASQSLDYTSDYVFPDLTEMNLNNQLILKGLLLNSSLNVLQKLESLKDPEIEDKVTKFRGDKALFSKQYSLSKNNRNFDLDSLSLLLNAREAELVKLYQMNFKDTILLSKDWKDIQSQLRADEIAIEFAHFDYYNKKSTDSTLYIAYLIKKEWSSPKAVYLFKESTFLQLTKNKTPRQLYSNILNNNLTDSIFKLVWEPIQPFLNGIKTIFYAPDGALLQISFSALSKSGEQKLSQQYNLVQLSSTFKILDSIKISVADDFLLIGGVDYEYRPSHMAQQDNELKFSLINETISRSESNHKRGEIWSYLPGTKNEIIEIQKITSKSKEVKVITGNLATEESIKKLSGISPKVLHIATHGFFFENPKLIHTNPELLNDEVVRWKASDDPLMRSGILLAGGNYAWSNNGNPFETEDGILTALEISNLDLKKTELAVMSACETGLGDIEDYEGVYGLQRALKMAGVKYLIMSLWKVPDKETTEFMTKFYFYWLDGMEIHNAFRQTQHDMIALYKHNPEKWGAFILVD